MNREHAIYIGPLLADSLAELERRSLVQPNAMIHSYDAAGVRDAILRAWQQVVDDVQLGRFDLSSTYLASLYEAMAGDDDSGAFNDLGEVVGTSWTEYCANVMDVKDDAFDSSYTMQALILAELRNGGHVRRLGLSLGWLCMNGIHLQDEVWPNYPPPADHDRLIARLDDAGPDWWDAEGLRALLGEYTDAQNPG